MQKPLLALDVDGPIALFGEHFPRDVRELWVGEVPITISRDVPQLLGKLCQAFQLVWFTSWERSASYQLAPLLGLPAGLPWVSLNLAHAQPGESRKLPALKKWLRTKGPLAVVDDEIGLDMAEWAESREQPTLLIQIDPRFGFGEAHLARLMEFAEEVMRDDQA